MTYSPGHDPNNADDAPDNGSFFSHGWNCNDWLIWLRACIAAGKKERWREGWNAQGFFDSDKSWCKYSDAWHNEVLAAFPDEPDDSIVYNASKEAVQLGNKVYSVIDTALDSIEGVLGGVKWVMPVAIGVAAIVVINQLKSATKA